MGKTADETVIALIDGNNYNDSDLLLLKFTLYAPYIQNNSSYQRCDGQVEFNGTQYNYVKRMVLNDTLYLYCIPNKQKTDIKNKESLMAQQHSDCSNDKKAEQSALKQFSFGNEYNNSTCADLNFEVHPFSVNKIIAFFNCTIQKGFALKTAQPPDTFI